MMVSKTTTVMSLALFVILIIQNSEAGGNESDYKTVFRELFEYWDCTEFTPTEEFSDCARGKTDETVNNIKSCAQTVINNYKDRIVQALGDEKVRRSIDHYKTQAQRKLGLIPFNTTMEDILKKCNMS